MTSETKYTKLAQVLKTSGYECYIVGGAVRDKVLGLKPHDVDFATNARPDEIVSLLNEKGIKCSTVGIAFGTVVAMMDEEEYEITTYRKEQGYSDGRHPDSVEYADTIEEDLRRRDFTMNAMAMDPVTNEIIDPFGGKNDLEQGVLRFVGNSEDRINEDALRIMRAARFAIKYGLTLSDEDTHLINSKAYLVHQNVSSERITSELEKILTCGKDIAPFFMKCPEILGAHFKEVGGMVNCKQNNKYHKHDVYEHSLAVVDNCKSDKFIVKLACLLHDVGKPACKVQGEDGRDHFYGHPDVSKGIVQGYIDNKSLILTKEQAKELVFLVEHHDENLFLNERVLKRNLTNYPEEYLKDLYDLHEADFDDHVLPPDITKQKLDNWHTKREIVEEMFDSIEKENSVFKLKDLAFNGHDAMSLGYTGKEIGTLLQDILEEVRDNGLLNSKDAIMEFVKEREEGREER